MADTFAASCFLSGGGGSHPCTVELQPRWLVVRPAHGPPVRWPYDALGCAVTGDERAWLTLTCLRPYEFGIEAVVFRDPALVAALTLRAPEPCRAVLEGFAAGARSHARRQRRGLWLFVAAAIAAVVAGWWSCTRLVPEIAADVMPVATEMQLGRVLVEGFLAGERRLDEGPAVDAVRAMVDRLAAAADHPDYRFTVHVVDDSQVNALALPGGQVVVFTGLLAEAGSPDEVAGVLAHEIQHVLHRHGLKRLVQQLGGAAVISLATGGGDLAGLAGRAGELVQLSFGREQEAEADRDGLVLLHRARFSPAAMAAFFERLQRRKPADMPEFLSTHPDTGQRIAELRRHITALPEVAVEPLDVDWEKVRASLKQ